MKPMKISAEHIREVPGFKGYTDDVIDALVKSGGDRKALSELLGDKEAAALSDRFEELKRQGHIRENVRSKWLERVGLLVPWPIRKAAGWMWRNKVPLIATAAALGVGGYLAVAHWQYLIGLFPALAGVKEYLLQLKGKIGDLGGMAMEKVTGATEAAGKGVEAAKEAGSSALEKAKGLAPGGVEQAPMPRQAPGTTSFEDAVKKLEDVF